MDVFLVSAHETFVSFANNPSFASSVKKVKKEVSGQESSGHIVGETEKEAANLAIPALTTPRTTAFMPALSPPEVSTAIFIFVRFVVVEERERR